MVLFIQCIAEKSEQLRLPESGAGKGGRWLCIARERYSTSIWPRIANPLQAALRSGLELLSEALNINAMTNF